MEKDAMKEALKSRRHGGVMIILGEPEISVQKPDKGSDLAPEGAEGDESEHKMPDGSMMQGKAMMKSEDKEAESDMSGMAKADMSPEEKFKMMFGKDMSEEDNLQGPPRNLQERAAKSFAAKYKKA